MYYIGKEKGVMNKCTDADALVIARNSITHYDRPANSKPAKDLIKSAKAEALKVASALGTSAVSSATTFWVGNALFSIANLATGGLLTPAQIALNTGIATSGVVSGANMLIQSRNMTNTALKIRETLTTWNGGYDIGTVGKVLYYSDERMSPLFVVFECVRSFPRNSAIFNRSI